MTELSENQIDLISAYIKQNGVVADSLHDDLLDHICTSIERLMDKGESFESAFDQTIKLFGSGGVKQVQQQTFELLTEMNAIMKKVTFYFGLASTILLLAGMVFKFQHLPGAGVLLITGNFFLVLMYLPLILAHKLRESEPRDYATIISGFIGLGVFAAGSTFKVMHWPGANVMIWSGFFLIGLVFLPLYFFMRYKTSANRSITITTAMIVLVGMMQIGLLLNLKNSSQFMHSSTVINEVLGANLDASSQNTALIKAVDNLPKATAIIDDANTIIEYIDQLKSSIVLSANPENKANGHKLSHLEKLDNFDASGDVLIGVYEKPNTDEFSATALKAKLDKYRTTILDAYDDETSALIELNIGFLNEEPYKSVYGRTESWEQYHFHKVTMAQAVAHLTKIQWEVRQAENQALLFLKIQSEAVDPPVDSQLFE